MTRAFAFVAAVVLLLPAPPDVQVLFSPRGGCAEAVVARLDAAKTEIRVQQYEFTLQSVADALVRAHRRGVDVAVILDKRQQASRSSKWRDCANAGIEVTFDFSHPIAHNKLVMIDRYVVIGGSWNPTAQADKNAENMTITTGPTIAKTYLDNWASHRTHSRKAA